MLVIYIYGRAPKYGKQFEGARNIHHDSDPCAPWINSWYYCVRMFHCVSQSPSLNDHDKSWVWMGCGLRYCRHDKPPAPLSRCKFVSLMIGQRHANVQVSVMEIKENVSKRK